MNQALGVIRVLHLEDSDLDADLIDAHLRKGGVMHSSDRVWTREDFEDRVTSGTYDLILADYKLPTFDGMRALEIARSKAPDIPFIFVSATLGEEIAIESLKKGATDYVIKSRLARLASCVERAVVEKLETTARRKAEAGIEDAQKRLHAALSVARMGSFEWDPIRSEVLLDARSCEILGLPEPKQIRVSSIIDLVIEEDRERFRAAAVLSARSRERGDIEFRVRRANGQTRYVTAACDWFQKAPGKFVGIGVLRDIDDRKMAEHDQKLVVRELHHRVKNSLATVQAVINATLRHADTLEGFRESIVPRIDALARSHSLLTDNAFGSLLLKDMLISELGAYNEGDRLELSGPQTYVSSDLAMTFSLALHELTTNSAKYGALSTASGHLAVSWETEKVDGGRLLKLAWCETGGPPIEHPPEHMGFGSVLLQRLLGGLPGASVDIRYEREGLCVDVQLRMADD